MNGYTNSPKVLYSNKNLLDNWDFTKPVNQRKSSSYSSMGYTIDRWILKFLNNATGTFNATTGLMSRTNSSGYVQLLQIIPVDEIDLKGKQCTLSLSIGSVANSSVTIYCEEIDVWTHYQEVSTTGTNTIISATFTFPSTIKNNIQISINTESKVKINAAKLEYGSISTLKNDILGVSYSEELLKCYRYYHDSRTSTDKNATNRARMRLISSTNTAQHGWLVGNIKFPVPMRCTPTISILSDSGNINCLNHGILGTEISNSVRMVNYYDNIGFNQVVLTDNWHSFDIVNDTEDATFQYIASADL